MPQRETASDRYTAASGLGSAIGDAARQYDVDPGPIYASLGVDPAIFHDLTGRFSLDCLCRLLETCALVTKDEAFGLKSIDHFRAGSTGPFGFGLMAAPTVLDHFSFLAKHHSYVAETNYSELTVGAQGAEFVWTYSPLIVNRHQFIDMTMGLMTARLRDVLGARIAAVEFGTERAKPHNLAPFRERLPRRLSFGRRVNSIRIPAELFNVANPRGDPRLFQLMDLQCRALTPEPPSSPDFVEELREFILARIADSSISLSEAADYFHVSERTLQRRLSDAGTSLADLRDEVRRDLARKLLVETDVSAAEIAHRLGYSQASAFTRSTIRWFGITPREYRKANASGR